MSSLKCHPKIPGGWDSLEGNSPSYFPWPPSCSHCIRSPPRYCHSHLLQLFLLYIFLKYAFIFNMILWALHLSGNLSQFLMYQRIFLLFPMWLLEDILLTCHFNTKMCSQTRIAKHLVKPNWKRASSLNKWRICHLRRHN